jgi:hypothetical protein
VPLDTGCNGEHEYIKALRGRVTRMAETIYTKIYESIRPALVARPSAGTLEEFKTMPAYICQQREVFYTV